MYLSTYINKSAKLFCFDTVYIEKGTKFYRKVNNGYSLLTAKSEL